MTGCPDLAALEARASDPSVAAHVAGCEACRIAADLIEMRTESAAGDRACARFEPLLAARFEGALGSAANALLEDHLAVCDECRAVAETIAPSADVRGDHAALPDIMPGSYALGSEVARGGMGRVIAARDLRIGRPVAVKELLGRSPRLAARFEREARLTARLQHPGIVPIYEIGRWPDGTPFYTMRMVEGRTLRASIHAAKDESERLALLPTLLAAAEAVAFAHGQRIIHRDLTPANILVGAYGETVVIDWGLAKDLGDDTDDVDAGPFRAADDPELTAAGAVLGTAPYMPPEQAEGRTVDATGDVYALGAILYHLLAGSAPYRGASSDEVLVQVKAGPPRSIRDAAPGAPIDLVSIVDKAMARERDARYASARELADELRRFQSGRLVEAHVYSRGELLRRWARRNRRPLAVAAIAALALAVGGAIAVVNVVRSRDRAEHARAVAEAQRAVADEQRRSAERSAAVLLEEHGRQAMLAGESFRAAAWLSASYSAGNDRASLRYLLANAMRDVESIERSLDCGDEVEWLTVSPDGAQLASVCGSEVRLWDARTGAAQGRLSTVLLPQHRAHYSHDGSQLVSWGFTPRGDVWLWDPGSGTLRATLAHGEQVSYASFSPDDRWILSSTFDGMVRLWDAATGALVYARQAGAAKQGLRASFLGTGDTFATITLDGTAREWTTATGDVRQSLPFPAIRVASFSDDDGVVRRIATCGDDGVARVWDDSGKLLGTFAGHSELVWSCTLDRSGRRLLTGSNDGTAKVWDVDDQLPLVTVTHGGLLQQALFSRDGALIATAAVGTGARVWDAASGMPIATVDVGSPDQLAFSSDGDRLFAATGARIEVIGGLRARAGAIARFPEGSRIADFRLDGRRASLVDDAGALTLWDVDAGTAVPTPPLRLPEDLWWCGALFATTPDGAILQVDATTGAVQRTLRPRGPPSAVRASRDCSRLAYAYPDGTVLLDLATGDEIQRWANDVAVLAFSDDARLVVSRDATSCTVRDTDTNQIVTELRGSPVAAVVGVVGDRVVTRRTGDFRSTGADIWDLDTGTRVAAIDAPFVSLTRSRRWVTIPSEGRFEVWRIADGVRVAVLPSESAWLSSADVTADGAFLVANDAKTGLLTVHDVSDGRVLASSRVPRPDAVTDQRGYAVAVSPTWFPESETEILSAIPARVKLPFALETRTADAIADIVATRVPFRVEDGRLVAR